MGKRATPCSKRELYKNLEMCTSISMCYDKNYITFLVKLFMRVSVGKLHSSREGKQTIGRPTRFAANNEEFWQNKMKKDWKE